MDNRGFYKTWSSLRGSLDGAQKIIANAGADEVRSALSRVPAGYHGFLALLSDAADGLCDDIKGAARALTAQRFGKTVNLYIPMYLSSSCVNKCLYCGFNSSRDYTRKTLSLCEVEKEGERLRAEGYRSILLVSGEDKKETTMKLLEGSVKLLKNMGFVFVGIEVAPLSVAEYRRLGEAGLDGVTVYQETYDEEIYRKVHLAGPKKDFEWRMGAAERVAQAGIRSVGIGFLLGLGDFRRDAICLAAHVKYLQKHFWQTMVSVSFPRIHHTPPGFSPENRVTDAQLIRLITAMRLANPDIALTLSTRESPALRDALFGVGINQVSAGSKTSPGGYSAIGSEDTAEGQFPVVDGRSPAEVTRALATLGLEQVWKDWDTNLRPVESAP
ncbi:MAG: 2-iminoacetate synthase ThiH [Nitrospinae bacterium]|nr:2-iminoacetate synthase ThiH [Nitrospinota bacterium]